AARTERHAHADDRESHWALAHRPADRLLAVFSSRLGRGGPVGRAVCRADPDRRDIARSVEQGVRQGRVVRSEKGASVTLRTNARGVFSIGLAIVLSIVTSCAERTTAPTADEARKFIDSVNETMLKLGVAQQQSGWVAETFVTDDT